MIHTTFDSLLLGALGRSTQGCVKGCSDAVCAMRLSSCAYLEVSSFKFTEGDPDHQPFKILDACLEKRELWLVVQHGLRDHSAECKHGESSILELANLVLLQGRGVLAEAKGIKRERRAINQTGGVQGPAAGRGAAPDGAAGRGGRGTAADTGAEAEK